MKQCLHLHIPKQKIPTVNPPVRGKTAGIFNAAFMETIEIYASRTAAAVQVSEQADLFWQEVIIASELQDS